jgi:hypothetical protein
MDYDEDDDTYNIDIYKQEKVTWEQVCKIVTSWIKYGDDPFYDKYSEILEEMNEEKDPEVKKRLDMILKLMDVLCKRTGW